MDYKISELLKMDVFYGMCVADKYIEMLDNIERKYPNYQMIEVIPYRPQTSFLMHVKVSFLTDVKELEKLDTQEVQ